MWPILKFYFVLPIRLWWEGWSLWAHRIRPLTEELIDGKASPDDTGKPDSEFVKSWRTFVENKRLLDQMRLLRRAVKYNIPIPTGQVGPDGPWELGSEAKWILLKDEPFIAFRESVRRETELRRTQIVGWVAPFSGIVGTVVGALLIHFLGK